VLKANAMSSVGPFAAIVCVMVLAYVSDYTRKRGLTTLFPLACLIIFEGALFALPVTASKRSYYALIALIQSQLNIWHTLNVTWLSTNCVTVRDRAIGLPMIVMAANAAGMIGPQLMQASQLTTFAFFLGVCISAGYFVWNGKRRVTGQLNEDHTVAEWVAEVEGELSEKEVRRRFVYSW
jgi:hypothetical protein